MYVCNNNNVYNFTIVYIVVVTHFNTPFGPPKFLRNNQRTENSTRIIYR